MTTQDSRPITDTRLGKPHLYMDCTADTFDPFWSADGSLYFLGNDGSGWHNRCSNNLFFNRVTGDDPLNLHRQGETINCMAEYGGWAQKGPDGCTWKSSGTIEVDGSLYLVVGRHRYGTDGSDPFRRQAADRASIIRSDDKGQTWTRSAQENYDQPMFPAGRFATPYFVHYGQGGEAPALHNAERYIYAISNNGFWCNGDNYILGRVARENIARLDPADWTYYTGGDGMDDSAWSPDADQAALIIENPLKCGETGVTFIPAINRYILIAWHYPGDPNIDAHISHFIYYEAPEPWGPWTAVREDEINPYGWYCPRVVNRWQAASEGEVQTVVVTGGDYFEMERYYKFTVVPLALKTDGKFPEAPPRLQPKVVRHDHEGAGEFQVEYLGAWETRERPGALAGAERFSSNPGDTFTIRFSGSQIRWFASKEDNHGVAAVSLDGGEEILVDQWTYCQVPQLPRMLFDSGPLEPGTYTLTVRVTGEQHHHGKGSAIAHNFVEVFEEPVL
jgi:hypothetical protein